jgi:hypothetical protein
MLLTCLTACATSHGTSAPVVEAPPNALAAEPVVLVPGEQMVWDVFWQGLTIGRAGLRVGPHDARSLFATGTLASALANIRHELTTDLGAQRVAHELVVYDGATRKQDVTLDGARFQIDGGAPRSAPGGASLHTLHTAIGAVRAWSRTEAPRAFLWLLVDGDLYRVDLERPHHDRTDLGRALRIESVVRPLVAGVDPLDVTIWLADTEERTPVRFVIVSGDHRISAELTESTAAFSR